MDIFSSLSPVKFINKIRKEKDVIANNPLVFDKIYKHALSNKNNSKNNIFKQYADKQAENIKKDIPLEPFDSSEYKISNSKDVILSPIFGNPIKSFFTSTFIFMTCILLAFLLVGENAALIISSIFIFFFSAFVYFNSTRNQKIQGYRNFFYEMHKKHSPLASSKEKAILTNEIKKDTNLSKALGYKKNLTYLDLEIVKSYISMFGDSLKTPLILGCGIKKREENHISNTVMPSLLEKAKRGEKNDYEKASKKISNAKSFFIFMAGGMKALTVIAFIASLTLLFEMSETFQGIKKEIFLSKLDGNHSSALIEKILPLTSNMDLNMICLLLTLLATLFLALNSIVLHNLKEEMLSSKPIHIDTYIEENKDILNEDEILYLDVLKGLRQYMDESDIVEMKLYSFSV
tara:strand:+ start:964 stop:2175 length:1212 start_codon:yes stop_codon:yes gene_type:complete